MRLDAIKTGDIVEVDRLGRRFHALVTGNGDGTLTVQPFDRRITYRSCGPRDVRVHWAKRGRTRAAEGSSPNGSTEQLELD
jgi:hypothetical protein